LSRHSHSSEIAALVSSVTSYKLFFAAEGVVKLFYFGLKLSYHLSAERTITQRRNPEYALEAGEEGLLLALFLLLCSCLFVRTWSICTVKQNG